MKEFYVSKLGEAITGPMELDEAIDSLGFYVSPKAKQEAKQAYAKGEKYEFHFAYGFSNNATVTVWLDHIK